MQARQMYLEAQTVEFVDMLTEYISEYRVFFFVIYGYLYIIF